MVAPGSTSKTTQSYPCCGPAQFNEILNLLLELLKIKTVSCECFFIDYAFLQHLSCEKLVFAFFGNPFFWLRRIQARSTLSILRITFLKSDVRRTQARDHFFAFSMFSHWTSSKYRNRHSHALRRSLFFLASSCVPVHILGFCNTSHAIIVFLNAATSKVLTACALFTSGLDSVIIIFMPSILNENPCRILTVLPRAWFSKLHSAKPTREHHFLMQFQIFAFAKWRFPDRRCGQTSKVASPRSARSRKNNERRNAWGCQFWKI